MEYICSKREIRPLKDIFIDFVYDTWNKEELKCNYELRNKYNTPILMGEGIIDCVDKEIKLILPSLLLTKELQDIATSSKFMGDKYSLFLDNISNVSYTNGDGCKDLEILMYRVQLESFSFIDTISGVNDTYIKVNPIYGNIGDAGIEISVKRGRIIK